MPRFLRQGLESKNGMTQSDYPRRIVCLTEETVETLYLLGEQDRIVGVSGYARRPPEVRRKPRVSAFRDADIDAILHLKPDLVLTFSDVQAEIARSLILRGATVLNFNQRTIAEIYEMIAVLARIVGKPDEGEALVARFRAGLDQVAASANKFAHHPRVYFEEWHDPLISGIGWVEELIEIAGGELAFPELRKCGKAQDRVVDPAAVVARDPEVIFASWCGMQVKPDVIRSRPGWSNIAAVRNNHIYEFLPCSFSNPAPRLSPTASHSSMHPRAHRRPQTLDRFSRPSATILREVEGFADRSFGASTCPDDASMTRIATLGNPIAHIPSCKLESDLLPDRIHHRLVNTYTKPHISQRASPQEQSMAHSHAMPSPVALPGVSKIVAVGFRQRRSRQNHRRRQPRHRPLQTRPARRPHRRRHLRPQRPAHDGLHATAA